MIVIGIAPGLKSLSYSVIDFSGPRPVGIDQETLPGPRVGSGIVDLAKKAYVHRLVLDVVFSREPPAILAIGPPCNPKEPPEYVAAVGAVLAQLARAFRAQVLPVDWAQMEHTLVPARRESWFRVVNRKLASPLPSDDRKIVLAVATALTGGFMRSPA